MIKTKFILPGDIIFEKISPLEYFKRKNIIWNFTIEESDSPIDRQTIKSDSIYLKEYFINNDRTLLSIEITTGESPYFDEYLLRHFYPKMRNESYEPEFYDTIKNSKIYLTSGSMRKMKYAKDFEFIINDNKIYLNLLFENINLY